MGEKNLFSWSKLEASVALLKLILATTTEAIASYIHVSVLCDVTNQMKGGTAVSPLTCFL